MKQTKQILVIEDDFSIRVLLEELLLDIGYTVVASERGSEALKLVNTKQFDLITLDLGLPDMSGSEFLRCLSQKVQGFPPPVVVISANPDQLMPQPHPYVKTIIPKPFNIEQIVEVVGQHV